MALSILGVAGGRTGSLRSLSILTRKTREDSLSKRGVGRIGRAINSSLSQPDDLNLKYNIDVKAQSVKG